jgi:hypothetical protein
LDRESKHVGSLDWESPRPSTNSHEKATRWLSNASNGIMLTTILAFLIWMRVLKNGFLHMLLPNLLPDPLGPILAVFYSTLITLLAGAGKIR